MLYKKTKAILLYCEFDFYKVNRHKANKSASDFSVKIPKTASDYY